MSGMAIDDCTAPRNFAHTFARRGGRVGNAPKRRAADQL